MRATTLVLTALLAAPGQDPPAASLLAADSALAHLVATRGVATALHAVLIPDALYLHDGADLVRGRARVRELLTDAYRARGPLRRQPAFGGVSADGTSGFTAGWTELAADTTIAYGRYLACWRRDGVGAWRVAAYVQGPTTGPPAVADPVIPVSRDASPALPRLGHEAARSAVLHADREFAALSIARGAQAAFVAYAAPEAIVIGGAGQLRRGPEAIGDAFNGVVPGYRLEWQPLAAFAAQGADMACTVGEATASVPDSTGGRSRSYTKYLTVWRRQPDGSWRYVSDMGNRRPARSPRKASGTPPPGD